MVTGLSCTSLFFNIFMNSKTPVRSKADILQFFQSACVPKRDLLIGLEVERSAVVNKDLTPVPFSGPAGYSAILKKLVEEVGWEICSQEPNGVITSLKRGGSEIHVEADGRLELVSKPRKKLSDLCREYQMHTREIDEISKEFGVRWISMGRKPFAKNNEISFMFPAKNKISHQHYRTCYPDWHETKFNAWQKKNDSVHVNFGYSSETDAIEKFQTLLKVSPILMAMFANSPFAAGKFSGFLTKRNQSNSLCCPHRTQVQELFFKEDFSFEKWIDYLLDLPMRRIERKGAEIFVPLTFRVYLEQGFGRYQACMQDFYLHIKSVWGEVRMKHYLEYRSFDTVPPSLIPSIPALVRGITFDSQTMKACQDLVKGWSFEDHLAVRNRVYKDALQAETPNGGKVLDLAKELLEIASTSLKKRQIATKSRVDTSRMLWPIKHYVFVREQSPAEYVMEMWNGEWHKDPRKLLEWSEQ